MQGSPGLEEDGQRRAGRTPMSLIQHLKPLQPSFQPGRTERYDNRYCAKGTHWRRQVLRHNYFDSLFATGMGRQNSPKSAVAEFHFADAAFCFSRGEVAI